MKSLVAPLAVSSCVVVLCAAVAAPRPPDNIAIPGGEVGVGYDDLQYAPALKRILVPAGRTGTLALIAPATGSMTAVGGFTSASSYRGGHGQGSTSASELTGWAGFVVATDRGAQALRVVDVRSGQRPTITQTVKLAAPPDYVRVLAKPHEVWVTEPARKQIEVLMVQGRETPRLAPAAAIPVSDGPESLVIDAARGKAYSHTWKDHSFALDLASRKVVATWVNGCRGARGIALDERRGLLFTACADGQVTVVELATHRIVSTAGPGPDVDSIGNAPGNGVAGAGHLYVPAGGSAELWILDVTPAGALTVLGKVPTAADAPTVAVDPVSGALFVGPPGRGAVLRIVDPFSGPAAP